MASTARAREPARLGYAAGRAITFVYRSPCARSHRPLAEGRTAAILAHFAFLIATNAAIGPFAQAANSRALAGLELNDPALADACADALIDLLKHGVLRPS